ncbi:ABC transporter permease [Kibdelosporangium aridum]|uniref:ABC transporter permease n=1 Tax=Kibdelosporangium aridum TaxID=2030 RepID=UPI0005242914
MVVHLALTELRLLFRKKLTLVSVLIVPALLCFTAWQLRDMPASDWPAQLGFSYVMLLGLSVVLVSTMVFTARRQSLVLQRLRTSELTDNGVFAGIAGPIMVVSIAQIVIYFGFTMAIGAPMPSQVGVVLIGLLLGLPAALLAGIVTAAFSRSVEATQITVIPVLALSLAGAFLARTSDETVATIASALPMASAGHLVAEGWAGSTPVVAVVATIGWLLVLGFAAHRFFKWEPRQ